MYYARIRIPSCEATISSSYSSYSSVLPTACSYRSSYRSYRYYYSSQRVPTPSTAPTDPHLQQLLLLLIIMSMLLLLHNLL